MKKIIGPFCLIAFFIFQGCDTVHESTINADGSGVYVTTMDMGKVLGMVKMFAQEKDEMKDLEGKKKDTLINFKDMKDSLKNLTDTEKKLSGYAGRKIFISLLISLFSAFRYSRH